MALACGVLRSPVRDAAAGVTPTKGAPPKPPPTRPGAPVPAAPPSASPAKVAFAPDSIAWWDRAWSHRRVLTLAVAGPLAPRTAAASFPTHGALASDGRDLRVVGPDGRAVGVELLETGPGDVVSFLFEAPDPAARYVAYFGCAAPATPSPTWTRDGGLVCEVSRWDRPFPIESPDDADLALRAATEVEARVLRPRIFDGAAPGGAGPTYVAVYRGFLRVADAGDYELCTASSGASILHVERGDVSQWSSARGPFTAQRGEFRMRLHLEAGAHPIEYFHFETGAGQPAAVVGIRKAGGGAWRVPWDADFVQPIQTTASRIEVATGAPPCDFAWTALQHFDAGGAHLVRLRFEATGPASVEPVRWDFGDGRSAAGSPVEHVFIGRGVRTVRLVGEDGGGREAIGVQRVDVRPLAAQMIPLAPGSEPLWSAALAEAVAAGLAAAEIAPALAAAQALDSEALEAAVADHALRRGDELAGAERAEIFLALASFFEHGKTWDAARRARALELAVATPGVPPALAARVALAAAREAAERGDGATALARLTGLRGVDLREEGMRSAALVRADALVTQGRLADAEASIARASDRDAEDRRGAEASRRARLHAVSAWITAGDVAAAVDGARDVLEDFPAEHLRAEAWVSLADAWLHLGEPGRAGVALARALAVEPDGPFTPRALLLLSIARTRTGDAAGAAAARARLTTEFPLSDEAAGLARSSSSSR